LVLRTAKWLTIHHNCGWGHDHKFNQKRLQPGSLDKVPLEIVVDDLWAMTFHSTVMSGDTINLSVFSYGQPAAGATVTIISDKGWRKRLTTDKAGRASFQMIRDYYPTSWSLFKRRKPGRLKFSAAHETDSTGTFDGEPYNRVKMLSTFSWRYYPAAREYSSLAYGLLVAVITMAASGVGIFFYRSNRSKNYRDISFDE